MTQLCPKGRRQNELRLWRNPPERALSVIAGRVDVVVAATRFRGNFVNGDVVRFAQAVTLRSRGFVLTHTPSIRNPDHVSVTYRDGWDSDVAKMFDECFDVGGE